MKLGILLAGVFAVTSIFPFQGADKFDLPEFVKELEDLGDVMEIAATTN